LSKSSTGEIDDVKFWDAKVDIGGPISDSEWVMRAEINVTKTDDGGDNIDKRFFFGIFDTDETGGSDTVQDGIWVSMKVDQTPGNRVFIAAGNNVTPAAQANLAAFDNPLLDPFITDRFFVELKRVSTTEMEVGFYTDNTYTDVIERIRVTINVNITDLQYIKIINEAGTGNGSLDATFKNLDFWNATSNTRTTIADSWLTVGTNIFIDKERSLVQFDAANQNSNEQISFDALGVGPSVTIMTFRFKLVINERTQGADATPVHLLIGLSGSDANTSLNTGASDWVGFRFTISNTLNEIRGITEENDNPVTDAQANRLFTTTPDPGTYYCEVTKDADIHTYFKLWRDKDFTDLIETIFVSGPTINSLRYFVVGNGDNGDGTEDSEFNGTVDEIQLWENVRVPDGFGIREWYHNSAAIKYASGTMEVLEIIAGDNSVNPGGNNYLNRHSLNGAADTTIDSGEGVIAQGVSNGDVYVDNFHTNVSNVRNFKSQAIAANTPGNNVPDRVESVWTYTGFSIDKITLINTVGGLYETDSVSTVWGSDPP